MNTPFEIQAFDLNDIGRRGMGRISCLVNGYWSHDPISLYINREWRWDGTTADNGTWKVEVSHSSGGRQTDPAKERGVASDLDAATNLGCALIALAALGRQIEARFPELEAAYQAQRELDRAAEAAEAAAKAERIAADPAIGVEGAQRLVEMLVGKLQETGNTADQSRTITARPRGNADQQSTRTLFIGRAAFSNKIVCRWNGSPIKRADAVAKLAELSAASCTPAV